MLGYRIRSSFPASPIVFSPKVQLIPHLRNLSINSQEAILNGLAPINLVSFSTGGNFFNSSRNIPAAIPIFRHHVYLRFHYPCSFYQNTYNIPRFRPTSNSSPALIILLLPIFSWQHWGKAWGNKNLSSETNICNSLQTSSVHVFIFCIWDTNRLWWPNLGIYVLASL